MITDQSGWLASVLAFAVSMSLTPGPNNAMVTASGANFGFMRTVPHMLGIAIGFPAMLAAMALGAGEALRAAPWLETIVRWIGIAYLLWLAFRIATSLPSAKDATVTARPLTAIQAALFQWVNPKAWVIALGAVAAYTTPDRVGRQAAALSAIFFVSALLSLAFWTAAGVGAGRLLGTPRRRRAFNLAMAALLVASLIPLAFESRA